MKIAIYSRKSKFTGKGESIENQIEMCKEYANKHFDKIEEFLEYPDEGRSGKDTDRPYFQKMIKDARKKKFDVLICYRLDRISRSVADFAETIEELNKYNIAFVSIREQFDTSTPMGRAMMFISSVFAQLERETTAERVRDNMHLLARSGRWLGGQTPMGFKSEPITYCDSEMNERKMYKLTPIDDDLVTVEILFKKYLELDSYTKLESWTIENNYRRKDGEFFSVSTLRVILTNPVYCKADNLIYDYFNGLDSDIASNKEEFDGIHGLMVFNKYDVSKNSVTKKDESEWIIAVGKHKGIIDSSDWIRVQNMIKANANKAPRKGTGKYGLLSGLIRCGLCGSPMLVRGKKRKSDGFLRHYYRCHLKERSKLSKCSVNNLTGIDADQFVIDELKKLSANDSQLMKNLSNSRKDISRSSDNEIDKKENLIKKISEYEENIKNLTMQLALNKESAASKYIIEQIEKLDIEIKNAKLQINEIDDNIEDDALKQLNIEILKQFLEDFSKNIDTLEFQEKKKLINKIIKQITWDGEKLEIDIYGQN
jgi:site-specific DNA recombinase